MLKKLKDLLGLNKSKTETLIICSDDLAELLNEPAPTK